MKIKKEENVISYKKPNDLSDAFLLWMTCIKIICSHEIASFVVCVYVMDCDVCGGGYRRAGSIDLYTVADGARPDPFDYL